MKGVRNFAVFESGFPDDIVRDSDDRVVAPGGRNILEFVREELTGDGWSCSRLQPHSFYGWVFDVVSANGPMRVLIQYPEPYLLTITRRQSLWKRLLGKPDDRAEVGLVQRIHAILSRESRVSELKWTTRADYTSNKPLISDTP